MILGLILFIVVPPFTKEFQQLIIQLPNAASTLSDLAVGTLERINDMVYGDNSKDSLGETKSAIED